ncbi:hypothetical protein Csa_023656, partial [Cucumis sativus]
ARDGWWEGKGGLCFSLVKNLTVTLVFQSIKASRLRSLPALPLEAFFFEVLLGIGYFSLLYRKIWLTRL